jgi:palmitoyl-protein thioesterase
MSASTEGLPVFFFHDILGKPKHGAMLEKALAAQGRAFVALSCCPKQKSIISLHKQVELAINEIRGVVASDERFQNGYVFVGHSQGAVLARAVVEEMDDHQVHTLVSLAGVQNGLFYGPQAQDLVPLYVWLTMLGPEAFPVEGLDYDQFCVDDTCRRGKVQLYAAKMLAEDPTLQDEFAAANLQRAPVHNRFATDNTFLTKINNVNKCESNKDKDDQERRKNNFLKLKAAHFFASPDDGLAAPWQTSVFGRYSHVDSVDEIESKFDQFSVVPMSETEEYVNDTFGLRTLDERGALFLHEVAGVPHNGWIKNAPKVNDPNSVCEFQDIYDKHIASTLP